MSIEPASLQGLDLTEPMRPSYARGTGRVASVSAFDELVFQDMFQDMAKKLCDGRVTDSDEDAPCHIGAIDSKLTALMNNEVDTDKLALHALTGERSNTSESCPAAAQPEQEIAHNNPVFAAKSPDLMSQVQRIDADIASSSSNSATGEQFLPPENLQPLSRREYQNDHLQAMSSDTGTGKELQAKSPILPDSNLNPSGSATSGVHSPPELLLHDMAGYFRITGVEANSTTFQMGFNGQFTKAVADLPELGQIVIRMQRNDAGVLVNLAAGSEQLPVLNAHADVLHRLIADTLLPSNDQVHPGTGAYPEEHHSHQPLPQGIEVRLSFSEHQGKDGNSRQPSSYSNETPDSTLPGLSGIPLSAGTRSFLQPGVGLIDVRV